jgi:hypothetical protein
MPQPIGRASQNPFGRTPEKWHLPLSNVTHYFSSPFAFCGRRMKLQDVAMCCVATSPKSGEEQKVRRFPALDRDLPLNNLTQSFQALNIS